MSNSKLEKAYSVFGDVILEEDDGDVSDLSLVYSPSPDFSREHHSSPNESLAHGSDKKKNMQSPDLLDKSTDTSIAATATTTRRNVTNNLPFDKIIQTTTHKEKENAPFPLSVNSLASTTKAVAPKRIPQQQQRPATTFRRFDKDRVKKTQDAIQQASASVKSAMSINPTMNAARKAKQETNHIKFQQTMQLKQEWMHDKLEAESFHQQSNQQRLRLLRLQQTLSSNKSQTKAQKEQDNKAQQLEQLEHESQFKSAVFRDHQQALKDERESRRRMSIAARTRLRNNNKQGQEQLKLQLIQEDEILYEERYEASRMQMNAKQQYAENRRQSFAFRNGDARRIRLLHQQMESERLEQESASIQLKLAAERDVDEEKHKLEAERRLSLANRNAHARMIRQEEEQRQNQAAAAEHASLELKWQAQKDADDYQRQLQKEQRQSLAQRNEHARLIRKQEMMERSEQLAAEHDSYQLKWAAEKDVEEYKRQLEQTERENLALANKEAKHRRELTRTQQEKEQALESKSIQLKLDGERDADEYRRQEDARRRQSLAQRNNYALRQRLQQDQHRDQLIAAEHENLELKWAGEKDAAEYKRQLEAEHRESLAWRNKEAFRRAKVMKELESLALEKERESLVLKWAGEEDAKKYLASLEEDRRNSLQLRGEQSQHHRQVEKELREKELQQQSADEEWKAGAQKDVDQYNSKCAARDRTSLQYRGKEAHVRRIEAKEQQLQEQQYNHSNFELETQARQDVEEYIRECKQRRRMSLALRAKEKSRHFQWRSQKANEERAAYSQEVRSRLKDQRSAELARQEERARRALEAIQHAGCSFNPFSSVL
ncbi:hypothetical protein MPSEU_000828400 [Mayamaea pseudoterrestris]|nr:hypothetical protein MPSEU_000828400 [Mayamaea pseudoterrestris]